MQLAKQSLTLTVINKGFVRRRSGYQIRLDYLQKAFVGEIITEGIGVLRPVCIVSSGGGGVLDKVLHGEAPP